MAFPDPKNLGSQLVDRAKTGILDTVSESGVGRAFRSLNLVPGAERQDGGFVSASWDDESERIDWRVKLSLPEGGSFQSSQNLSGPLAPLVETGGLVFPYTPNIYITYSANYDSLAPTHSNYPFPVYQNSAVDQFTITGEFTVENSAEGKYWIAANHYLRSVTKMAYGKDTPNRGAPPPVIRLNGYGDFVFNNVPVVIQQFNVELLNDVDYIKVDVGQNGSWAPTRSNIAVSVVPAFSRDSVNKFSLKKFVEGDYINNDPGFL